ncbi:MAG TPA: hypothetical protein VGP79_11510 [Bryobacteraceae bacterium]|jgi:hypothetical protein|nr:hypothetical protein [Bryobacteraceae bacterium]
MFDSSLMSVSFAIASSLLCLGAIWLSWKKSSRLSVAAVVIQKFGAVAVLSILMGSSLVQAADLSTYRGLKFGINVSDAAKLAGARPGDLKLAHQRPSTIQEMLWQPRSPVFNEPGKADSVKEGLLYFVNDQLFRIVITYDRYKVEGMTADDMIEGISTTYGPATKPAAEIAFISNYSKVARVVARWEDAEYSYDLVRSGDQSTFALVLYSKRLDALAQTAITESLRLETLDAPQRELARQAKKVDDARLLLEKSRSENKLNFRP